MKDWQPIETAPKEGSFIVTGGTLNDEIYRGGESYHMAIVTTEPNSIVEALADKQKTRFDVINTCYYSVWVSNPTHWMPLPIPPQEE